MSKKNRCIFMLYKVSYDLFIILPIIIMLQHYVALVFMQRYNRIMKDYGTGDKIMLILYMQY